MNTTFTFRIDEKEKKEFLKNSRQNGLDASILLRHFIRKYNKKPKIVKLEIEEDNDEILFDRALKKALKDEKIQEKLNELGEVMRKIAKENK